MRKWYRHLFGSFSDKFHYYIEQWQNKKKPEEKSNIYYMCYCCYTNNKFLLWWALFGMELLCRISCKVLEKRSSHEMVAVRLTELLYLLQQFVCSVRINKPERTWENPYSSTLIDLSVKVLICDYHVLTSLIQFPQWSLLASTTFCSGSFWAGVYSKATL